MVELAPAHAAPYLANTEPDPVAQTWASPIRVRRRRVQAEDPNQLALLVEWVPLPEKSKQRESPGCAPAGFKLCE